jgi:hypothetical protein
VVGSSKLHRSKGSGRTKDRFRSSRFEGLGVRLRTSQRKRKLTMADGEFKLGRRRPWFLKDSRTGVHGLLTTWGAVVTTRTTSFNTLKL